MPAHRTAHFVGFAAALVLSQAFAQSTTTTVATPEAAASGLQAGAWTASVKMVGAPGGDKNATVNWCWKEPVAAPQREQALLAAIESNMPQQSGRGGAPKCAIQAAQRSGAQSQWQASCDGPMGKIKGSGTGQFEATQAQTQQEMTARMLGMSMKLQQLVDAKRSGGC